MKIGFDRQSYLLWATYGLLVVLAAVVGGVGGMLLGYSIDLPQVEELQQVRPNVVSYVYSAEGEVIGQFALEKRILVSYDQIPETIKNAVISSEDSDFFEHTGIDFSRLFVAVMRDIFLGERKGASTLTMQLCKLRFTGSEKRFERKVKDMLFAIETEKKFSKEQIFALYFNQIYMGHGIYGIAAAADFYFNKTLDELSVADSALLAGILQVPERLSPIRYPERALQRRGYVLRRMLDEGYITSEVFQHSMEEPLQIYGRSHSDEPAPYFVEWVRQHLEQNYDTENIWKGGLKIYTTLDLDMQLAANQAVRDGLRGFDKQTRRWQGASENVLKAGKDLDSYSHPDWEQLFYEDQLIHGLVLESDTGRALIKFGSYKATLGPEDIKWSGKKQVDQALRPGDVEIFSIHDLDTRNKTLKASLDRVPEVQGALLLLDNNSGAIKAMVGGFDFERSKFNRATQALRQPGSLFKPFTYLVALEQGRSIFDSVLDAPVSFFDDLGRPYSPKNSDGQFKGLIPLKQALAESRNVPTIRLANALGIKNVISMAQRFGIERDFLPVLPMALGAGEVTLEEITSAFSAFGNRGVRARPFFIQKVEDYNGQSLEEHQVSFEQAVSPEISAKMLYLLRQVVLAGTSTRVQQLKRPVAGKTGTTNEATDAWFVGLTPHLTGGVWVGYDEKKSLGRRAFGANVALPIWLDFMQKIVKDLPNEDFADIYVPQESDRMDAGLAVADADELENKIKGTPTGIRVEEIPPPTLQGKPPGE